MKRVHYSIYMIGIAVILSTICQAQPAEAASAGTCDGLSARLSDDKNYELFTASATPQNGYKIVGYNFSFGDQQTYSFLFGADSDTNRNQATVTHVYQRNGTYVASVKVIASLNNQQTTLTSPNCSTNVPIGIDLASSTNELVNTGPGGAAAELFGLSLIGGASGHYLLRRKQAGCRAERTK